MLFIVYNILNLSITIFKSKPVFYDYPHRILFSFKCSDRVAQLNLPGNHIIVNN